MRDNKQKNKGKVKNRNERTKSPCRDIARSRAKSSLKLKKRISLSIRDLTLIWFAQLKC